MSFGEMRLGRMRIHGAACLLMAVWLFSGNGAKLAAYFLCLLWHEGAHSLCAIGMGYRVPEMEWTPFGAVARIEEWHHIPYNRQLLIALAGPLASLMGVLLCFGGLYILPAGLWIYLIETLKAHLYLLFFNMLPVLPLDGGRILCAFIFKRWRAADACAVLAKIGVWFGCGVVIAAAWLAIKWRVYNLSLAISGCYLAYSAAVSGQTTAGLYLRSAVEKHVLLEKRGMLPVKYIAIDCHRTVRFAANYLEPGYYHQIKLVDPFTYHVLGEINEEQLQTALLSNQETVLQELGK